MNPEDRWKHSHHPISAEEQRLLRQHNGAYARARTKQRQKEVLKEAVDKLSRLDPSWTVRAVKKWFQNNRSEEKHWRESLHAIPRSELQPDQVPVFLKRRKKRKVE